MTSCSIHIICQGTHAHVYYVNLSFFFFFFKDWCQESRYLLCYKKTTDFYARHDFGNVNLWGMCIETVYQATMPAGSADLLQRHKQSAKVTFLHAWPVYLSLISPFIFTRVWLYVSNSFWCKQGKQHVLFRAKCEEEARKDIKGERQRVHDWMQDQLFPFQLLRFHLQFSWFFFFCSLMYLPDKKYKLDGVTNWMRIRDIQDANI